MNLCSACGGSTPICLQNACVQCQASSDCSASATTPICDQTSHTCVPCTSDDQCAAKLGSTGNPGVCRSEIDGHCATDVETIYVQQATGCTSTYALNGPGGTATDPYCSMEPVALATSATKTLVVIRGTVAGPDWTYQRGQGQPATTFVGQQTALIASSTMPGFNMDSGTVYIRDVAFSSAGSLCVEGTGGTLNLDAVVVDSCKAGGIYLDGAAFDIEDTTVTNNSLAQLGAASWSGILVNSLPSTGPTTLDLVTIQNNQGPGLECAGPITGTGVLATGNGTPNVAGTCNVTACVAAGSTCGAQ